MATSVPARPPIGLLLRLLHQHYARDHDAALRAAGFGDIRPAHANVFPFVPREGISVSALGERALVRKQTMAQSIDELERLGYVERRPNPDDGRSRLVFLTTRGAAVRPLTLKTAARVEKGWADLTSPKELEALRAGLLRLLTAIDAEQVEGAAWRDDTPPA